MAIHVGAVKESIDRLLDAVDGSISGGGTQIRADLLDLISSYEEALAEISRHTQLWEAWSSIDWYVRCLEDVQDRRPVRDLPEARAAYDSVRDLFTAPEGVE